MLGASWAQRRTYSLRLARNVKPWRSSGRQISLSLTKVPHLFPSGFTTYTPPRERTRAQTSSTSTSSVTEQAVALLEGRKVEEAVTLLSQFRHDGGNEQLVLEVVDGFMGSQTNLHNAEILFLWLESFPDATNASSDIFRQIFDRLKAQGWDDLTLIRRFGVLCASKGYHDFVSTHIAPVLYATTTSSEFSEWEHSVQLAAEVFKGLWYQPGSVLEKDSRDYDSIDVGTFRVPTTLQLVEENLPDILPMTSLQDQTVFEDLTDEYAAYAPSQDSLHSTKSHTSRALEELVQQSKFEEAYHLLLELEELGISPTPSDVYQSAAIAILEVLLSPDAEIENSVVLELQKQYVAWLQLLPSRHLLELGNSPSFQKLKYMLFHSVTPNLFLISQTALILTSKGFADTIVKTGNRILYSESSSPFDSGYILELEAINQRYWQQHQPKRAREWISKVKAFGRASAIRSISSAGRFDVAIELLPDPLVDDVRLPKSTFNILLRHIRQSGPAAVSKYQDTVLRLMGGVPLDLEYDGPSLPIQSLEHDLEKSLEYLKDALKPHLPPPHPMTILTIIESCVSTGQTRVLTQLLNKAMVGGYHHTSAFLYAEMVYYYRHQQFDALVETITDHFYLGAGLPRGRILGLYKAQKLTSETPASTRFHEKELLTTPTKLWPSTAHCNLVWQILALQATDNEALATLYKKLRNTIKQGQESAGKLSVDPLAKINGGTTMNRLPGASAFVPYMRGLMIAYGPEKGSEIMGEMMQLGMQPTVAHLSEFAHQLARSGDGKSAMAILTNLEARVRDATAGGGAGAGTGKDRLHYGSPLNRRAAEIVPDATMYVSLMQAFISAGDVKRAEEVAKRFKKSGLQYNSNQSVYVQKVFQALEELKSSGLQRYMDNPESKPWRYDEEEFED